MLRTASFMVALALLLSGRAGAQQRGTGAGDGSAAPRATYGEQAPAGAVPGGDESRFAPSGDRIRSWSSADVRETRREPAPDLEIAGASPHTPGSPQKQP